MVTLEFHDPAGTLDAAKPYAPRLDGLAGRKIGMLSNGQWQAFRMLPLLKTLLEADFPGIEVIPEDRFPQGNTKIGTAEVVAQVQASGVDAVIVGNAA